jgi:hypothetical protein
MHRWWIKGREKDPTFFKPDTQIRTIKNWGAIIILAIVSIIYFIKTLLN